MERYYTFHRLENGIDVSELSKEARRDSPRFSSRTVGVCTGRGKFASKLAGLFKLTENRDDYLINLGRCSLMNLHKLEGPPCWE